MRRTRLQYISLVVAVDVGILTLKTTMTMSFFFLFLLLLLLLLLLPHELLEQDDIHCPQMTMMFRN